LDDKIEDNKWKMYVADGRGMKQSGRKNKSAQDFRGKP
jgi:hypothetical protein